ncbi:MAG: hypothetical protein FWC76_06725, partial [Defluviitaleaceae bacterium]|nr:hypothetical protein [Defluviitaleaceae bacterium]
AKKPVHHRAEAIQTTSTSKFIHIGYLDCFGLAPHHNSTAVVLAMTVQLSWTSGSNATSNCIDDCEANGKSKNQHSPRPKQSKMPIIN